LFKAEARVSGGVRKTPSHPMTEATLDENRSRLLDGLTIAAAQRLGGDTFMIAEDNGVRRVRMARAGVLLDHPADTAGPRSINAYLVEVQDFTAAALGGEGKKFKLDPQRLHAMAAQRHAAGLPAAARARSGAVIRRCQPGAACRAFQARSSAARAAAHRTTHRERQGRAVRRPAPTLAATFNKHTSGLPRRWVVAY
jgi:hypothetical protein